MILLYFSKGLHEMKKMIVSRLLAVADLHSKILDNPLQSNFLHFNAVFGKFWPNNRLAPPFRLVPPGNPGSTTGLDKRGGGFCLWSHDPSRGGGSV